MNPKSDRPFLPPRPRDNLLEQPLTRDELSSLRRFSRHGGPSLSELRGYCDLVTENSMSVRPSRRKRSLAASPRRSSRPSRRPIPPTSGNQNSAPLTRRSSTDLSRGMLPTTTNVTKKTKAGAYGPAFRQHLIDHNILPPAYEYANGDEPGEPGNVAELRKCFSKRRQSLSRSQFSKEDFKRFRRADARAVKEGQMGLKVMPFIEGNHDSSSGGTQLNNLKSLTDGSLPIPRPDIFYGAQPEQLNTDIRKKLGKYIVPSTQNDLPLVPNNFLELKGPDGTASVVQRQALYHAALGARGFQQLMCYGLDGQDYDNKAHVLAWTYYLGNLKAYTVHVLRPSAPGGMPTYTMTHLNGWDLTGDRETFRNGVAAFRNGRDWAKSERDKIISEANRRHAAMRASSSFELQAQSEICESTRNTPLEEQTKDEEGEEEQEEREDEDDDEYFLRELW